MKPYNILNYSLSGEKTLPNGEKAQDILDYTELKEPIIDIIGDRVMPEGVDFGDVKDVCAGAKQAYEYYAPQVQSALEERTANLAEMEVAQHETDIQTQIDKVETKNLQIETDYQKYNDEMEINLENEIDEYELEL
ncbi:MAG: hypothetical protein LBM93_14140 [Oscillospiraceae bacterium]|jgi:hypothetical protein|nr:hypothetical protein [Oscillospiraceae bacterium]